MKRLTRKESVQVYGAPLTAECAEGVATVEQFVKEGFVHEGHEYEFWTVRFDSDGFVCDRLISNRDIVSK